MKKICCLTIALLAAFSMVFGQKASALEAQTVATAFFQAHLGEKKAGTMAQVQIIGLHREKSEQTNPGFFVFEPADGEGFVMVSSQKNTPPVLCYSLTQNFDLANAPESLLNWLDNYAEQIKDAGAAKRLTDMAVQSQWNELLQGSYSAPKTVTSAGPLLTTTWGQDFPYNGFCPTNGMGQRALTGCVATAMAQIMKYWSYPIVGQGGIATDDDDDASDGISGVFSANIGGTVYDWEHMDDVIDAGNWAPIALLMQNAGVAAQMNYGIDASGAFSINASAAMHNFFGYNESPVLLRDNFDDEEWENLLRNSIGQGIPVYYAGTRHDAEGNEKSHAWVCDGFNGSYFHMNWGWDGDRQDIWFLLDNLNGKPESPYHYKQHAMMTLLPPYCTPSHFSSGVAIANVQVAHWIHANSTVVPLPGLSVTFDAHDEITLLPGFQALEGSTFTAVIEGCGGNYFTGNDEAIHFLSDAPESIEKAVKETDAELRIAPNPFSGSTTVTYSLQDEQQVAMQLMDATGKLVATPMRPQIQSEGAYEFSLDGSNLPAGMYFLVTQIGETRETKRLVLTR